MKPFVADSPPFWQAVLFPAMAGGMGWGIRGQYGHETGAMIAGVLVSLTLATLFCRRAAELPVARAVAWGTIAMGIGGSMTYGQTVGLTQNPPVIGNWAALGWGMLGLAIKGAVWIGFGAVFLGMGLGGARYRPQEIGLVLLVALGVCAAGIWLVNEPFDPAHQKLPSIYFSAAWRWEPGAELKPRREVWGGLLFALAAVIAYAHRVRRDPLAGRLAVWGLLGGGLGFPLGQGVQAFHAWHAEMFRSGVWSHIDPVMNWWNFMETTFGAIMGAALGIGLWLNRARIGLPAASWSCPESLRATRDNAASMRALDGDSTLPAWVEWVLLAGHVGLLIGVEFTTVGWIDAIYDFGLMLVFIPLIVVAGGRWWPYLAFLPITLVPIAGKTFIAASRGASPAGTIATAGFCIVLPLALMSYAAIRIAAVPGRMRPALGMVRSALLLTCWVYFGLNFAFFEFPWPWATWTARTPNALVFTACAAGLTWLALRRMPDCDPGAEAGDPRSSGRTAPLAQRSATMYRENSARA